jgi:hypothetical protein
MVAARERRQVAGAAGQGTIVEAQQRRSSNRIRYVFGDVELLVAWQALSGNQLH